MIEVFFNFIKVFISELMKSSTRLLVVGQEVLVLMFDQLVVLLGTFQEPMLHPQQRREH